METKRFLVLDKQSKNLKDKLSTSEKRPRGHVEIFEGSGKKITESDKVVFPSNSKIEDRDNLIVYNGRTWLMQRAFDQDLTPGSNASDRYISWFALGTGGAPVGDPLNPTAPVVSDTSLNTQIVINSTDPACANSGYLHPFDSIVYQQDPSNSNEYLIAQITTTISTNDANGAGGSTFYDLSEAGLYISNSNTATLVDPTSLILFARVTFSTIRKHDEREIVFVWSVYF